MRFTHIIIISIFLLNVFACENKALAKTDTERYNENASQLINEIFKKEDCYCSCLVLYDNVIDLVKEERPDLDVKSIIMSDLNFKSDEELKHAQDIAQSFDLASIEINNNVKVLRGKVFQDFLQKNFNNFRTGKVKDYDKAITDLCPNGIASVTKPVFDTTFKTALIDVQIATGCFRNPFRLYNKWDSKWVN